MSYTNHSARGLVLLVALLSLAPVCGPYPTDPTEPVFSCLPTDQFCNLADPAGVGGTPAFGRGAAFADIDGDGFDDLLVCDPDNRFRPGDWGVSTFHLNDGAGGFVPVDVGIDAADLLATWGASFADFDNDGDPDLAVANGGATGPSTLELFENRMDIDATFANVTDASGIGTVTLTPSPWWGVSWADYDGDGLLDLAATRVVGRPLVFHNDGNGAFTEVGLTLGVGIVSQDGKNPVWFDFDADGDPDLYVAGLFFHALYRNDGGTSFVDVTGILGANYPGTPELPAGLPMVFSAAAADFDQDGFDDLYLGRWMAQDLLLQNDGLGGFVQLGSEIGLDASNTWWDQLDEPLENTMGLGIGDLDDDGYPDVLIGTGSPERAARDLVYCNDGTPMFIRCGGFIRDTADREHRTRGHGVVFSDIDHDGDSDFFWNLGGHPLWDESTGGESRQTNSLWVRQTLGTPATATLTLEGSVSNRDAIGARVRVDGSQLHHHTVRSTQGFQSQNSNALVVTLGTASQADVEIDWPSGATSILTISQGQSLHVVEPL